MNQTAINALIAAAEEAEAALDEFGGEAASDARRQLLEALELVSGEQKRPPKRRLGESLEVS